jgi:hypothetical protein
MDDCRFDNWTRMLGAIEDRRAALKKVAGVTAALAALARVELGFAQEGDDVLVEACRLSGDTCTRNKQCCSNRCSGRRRRDRRRDDRDGRRGRRRRREGTCRCLTNGKICNRDAACCRGRCDPFDGRCRCVPTSDRCDFDQDCCSGSCLTDDQGNKFCSRERRRRRRNRRNR